jgi:hypothetical protein
MFQIMIDITYYNNYVFFKKKYIFCKKIYKKISDF